MPGFGGDFSYSRYTAHPHTPRTIPSSRARSTSAALPQWWDSLATPPARPSRVPPDWGKASDLLKATYFHIALASQRLVHAFSLNLSPDVEAKARAHPRPLEWLRRRVDRELKLALGRDVDWFAGLEETPDDRRLHLHGEIGLKADEAELARKALRRAGGEWESARQHQAHTQSDPDAGWIGYVAKDFHKTTPFRRALCAGRSSILVASFDGAVLTKTLGLNRQAKAIFEKHRSAVLKYKSVLI